MKIDLSLRNNFSKISALYDQVRVSYPPKLINDIVMYSKISKNSNVLDVGCGTGQATLLFAERGFSIIGVDISKQMIAVAKQKCVPFPKCQFAVSSFEQVDFPESSFGLIVSGLAWHWVRPGGRYEKAHHLLKPEGTLALFWSYLEHEKSSFLQMVSTILDRYGKQDSSCSASPKIKNYAELCFEELKQNPLFLPAMRKEYQENISFSLEQFSRFVSSYSWVLKLPKERQRALVKELQEIQGFQEPFLLPFKYILVMTKKRK